MMADSHKFRITLQRQMQIEFLSQANSNYMIDADVVSVADLPIVGMEELEVRYRCRGRFNFRKMTIATIAVRMVSLVLSFLSFP